MATPQPDGEDQMHTPLAHSLALISFLGKAAVGGAGLALALLGAVDLLLASPTHGWVVGMITLYLPYFAAFGAAVGAFSAFARRRPA
jgi:hypothetical protein